MKLHLSPKEGEDGAGSVSMIRSIFAEFANAARVVTTQFLSTNLRLGVFRRIFGGTSSKYHFK